MKPIFAEKHFQTSKNVPKFVKWRCFLGGSKLLYQLAPKGYKIVFGQKGIILKHMENLFEQMMNHFFRNFLKIIIFKSVSNF